MEYNSKDAEEETEDEEEGLKEAEGEEQEKEEVTATSETDDDQEDLPSVLVPTVNIREERLINLAETPAFLCLHEVCFSLYTITRVS
jgi:hypothetical protein